MEPDDPPNPRAWSTIRRDLAAVLTRDPAATSLIEVLLAYPGFHAIVLHRVAYGLHRGGVPVLPRLLSHFTRFVTGIEIHPAAQIGSGFFIDHGMGVVIGETAQIGDDVTLYQGVTLGGTGQERGKRHPTIGDHVTIGAGAKLLGAITVGSGAIIGAGSVVLRDVPPNTTVVGVPGRVVIVRDPERGTKERVVNLPDPEYEVIRCLHNKVHDLETRLAALEGRSAPPPPDLEAIAPFDPQIGEEAIAGPPERAASQRSDPDYGSRGE